MRKHNNLKILVTAARPFFVILQDISVMTQNKGMFPLINRVDMHTNQSLYRDQLYIQYRKATHQHDWELHSHDGYEIYYFQKGKANFIIGSAVYPLQLGDMLVFNGKILHHAKPFLGTAYVRSYVNFVEPYVRDLLPSELMENISTMMNREGGLSIRWNESERSEVEKLLFQIFSERNKKVLGYEVMMKSYFLQLLLKIYRAANSLDVRTKPVSISQKEINVQQVLKLINEHFQDDLSLDDMAGAVHLNKHYMCHCFKDVTGMTVTQYLAKRRVDEAKKMLLGTNTSISRISEVIGLNNGVQFSRLFKQHIGVSPQAFRKMYRENQQSSI